MQLWINLLQTQGRACPASNSSCPSVLQVGGFAWENCGDKRDPVVLQSLSVAPDPISIPGSLRVSAAVKSGKTMGSPLKVSARCPSVVREGRASPNHWQLGNACHGYRNEQPLGSEVQRGAGLSTLDSVSQNRAGSMGRPVVGADSSVGDSQPCS